MPRSRGGRRTSRSCSVTLVASRNRCCGSTGAHSSSGPAAARVVLQEIRGPNDVAREARIWQSDYVSSSLVTTETSRLKLAWTIHICIYICTTSAARRGVSAPSGGQRSARGIAMFKRLGPNGTRFGTHARLWLQDTMPTLPQVVRECPRPSSCRPTPSPSVASDIEQPLQPLLPGRQRAVCLC